MLRQYGIRGNWLSSASSQRVVVVDYAAGLLVTTTDNGEEVRGSPEDFRSTDGESGTSVLARIMIPPSTASLRYGAIRESIASAHSVALFGFHETRAWDGPNDYIIDTGEGSCGAVRFIGAGCVAAMINYDPWRHLDIARALSAVPPSLRDAAQQLCGLPLLNSPSQLAVSSIFWSEGGPLQAHEPWVTVYEFGAELLRRELAGDDLWKTEAGEHHDLDNAGLSLVISMATRRASSGGNLTLTEDELRAIVPFASPHHSEAVQLLSEIGFAAPSAVGPQQ